MLDIKLLRENKELVIENLTKREGFDTTIVDKVLEVDIKWRAEKKALDELKSQKNKESKAIAEVKKSGGDIKTQIAKVKKVSELIAKKDEELKELLEKRDSFLTTIPNMLDTEVPKGADDEANIPIRFHLKQPIFDFEVKNHQDLCEQNNWYNMDKAAKVSGARFYYTKGDLVLLELGLFQFVMDKLNKKGYTPVITPPMLSLIHI